MPRPFIKLPGRDTNNDTEQAGDQVRWARKDKRDGAVEAETADDSREEVVETASRKVHVLHKAKQVETRIADGLCKTGARAFGGFDPDGVARDAVVRELALLGRQPARSQGEIGKHPYAHYGDHKGHDACKVALANAFFHKGSDLGWRTDLR